MLGTKASEVSLATTPSMRTSLNPIDHLDHRPGPRRGGVGDSARAFSLIELCLVSALIATIAAIAIPRYGRGLARYGVDAAAARIAADLSQARMHARATGAAVRFTFNPDENSYGYNHAVSLEGSGSGADINLAGGDYRVQLDVADAGGDTSLHFNAFGEPDSDATIAISRGSEFRLINLSAATTSVTVTRVARAAYDAVVKDAPAGVRRR
jgi:type II secretory pathway pseudopilin PulG